tara:strand:+ start:1087 stop:2796 length:1710 start_codon:yes stop_codon:yes gene_type:complete
MIVFEKVRFQNFLSYGDFWTEINLNTNASTLIIGDNGAGKSTMIDAIAYGLYGKAFRRIATTQLVNSVNKNHMVVEVEFKINRTKYKIVRGLKPRLFEVWQDDKLLNQDANARDYQEVLEKQILKINHKSFTQIVVLGSSNFVPFMQLRTNERREVIEDLLDIGVFSVMSMLLKDKVSDNKSKLQETKYQLDLLEQKIDMMHEHINQLQTQQDDDVAQKKEQIEQVQFEINSLKIVAGTHQTKITKLQEQIADKEEVTKQLRQSEKIMDQLVNKVNKLEKEVAFFENHDECPTCKQPLDENHKHTHIDNKTSKKAEVELGVDQLQDMLDTKNARLAEIVDITAKLTEEQHQLIDTQSIINSKDLYIKELKSLVDAVSDNTIEDERKKIDALLVEKDAQYEIHCELVEKQNVYDLGQRLLKDTGIKARIIKQYVPIMNKLINKYLAAMDFFVQFELDEQFNETIKSRFRDDFSYESFSEGEKMRIDLALLFTWRAIAKLKNSASTNLLIMDEVFDSSLDTTGTDEFMKIIRDLVSDTNVFIISHKTDMLVDKFTNVLRFEKSHNFSRFVE